MDPKNLSTKKRKWGIFAAIFAAIFALTAVAAVPAFADPDDDDKATKNVCYDDAGVLGWMMCPIIQSTSGTINGLYEKVETQYLQIDAQQALFTNDSATHTAWASIRDIANIIFAIVILVVIFSQLTGVGIDNYGIKRILPRLIIAAILVNFSWYICKVLIDFSNIIGISIKGLLTSLTPKNVNVGKTDGLLAATAGWSLDLVGVVIGVGALIISPGLALGVLVAILGVLVGIVFFWLILVAREVATVLIVILAPLAFVCYVLPNTENLFKRWTKIFEAMLVLYPICAMCVGGGAFVSGILGQAAGGQAEPDTTPGTSLVITSEFASISPSGLNIFAAPGDGEETEPEVDTGLALAAMIVQVVPFFFIPMLLKNSLAGIGNIGAKLSGLGSKIGRGATTRIRNTDAYKDKQLRMNAGYNKDGKQTGFGALRAKTVGKTRFGQRRMGKYEAAYVKDRQERKKAELLNDPDYMQAAFAAQDSTMNKEKLEAEIANMKADTGNYTPAVMKRQLKEYMEGQHGALTDENGEVTSAGLRARALMKKMSTSGGLSQKDMTSIFAKAGRDENGNQQISADNLKFAAKFMQSDSDVHKAMAAKDTATAQFLRDINSQSAGQVFQRQDADGNLVDVDLSSMTRQEWASSRLAEGSSTDDAELRSGNDNLDFVLDKVIDKNTDLAAQSDGAVQESVDRLVQNGNTSRLQSIYDDDYLYNSLTEGAQTAISSAIGKPKVKSQAAPSNDAMNEVDQILNENTPSSVPGYDTTPNGIIVPNTSNPTSTPARSESEPRTIKVDGKEYKLTGPLAGARDEQDVREYIAELKARAAEEQRRIDNNK